MNASSKIESEFDSPDAAAAHDAFVRRKVKASLADQRDVVAHDVVMAEIDSIIAEAERR
jgi:hypothetical protein